MVSRTVAVKFGIGLCALALGACGGPTRVAERQPLGVTTPSESGAELPSGIDNEPSGRGDSTQRNQVLAISVDGLSSVALEALGTQGAPAIWSIFSNGMGTLNARSDPDYTLTLPNHVGMMTGRPVAAEQKGHGVTWNGDFSTQTVQEAARRPIASVLTLAQQQAGTTAVFAAKSKLGIFERSWPGSVTRNEIDSSAKLYEKVTRDLQNTDRAFTFVHLAGPDDVGHTSGWDSAVYDGAVREADSVVQGLLSAAEFTTDPGGHVFVILTADHGGGGREHGNPNRPSNYTIPFVLAGPGLPRGDLYDLAPGLADPGTGHPAWTGPQPVRNCDVANVATALLGLDGVPGSRCRAAGEMPLQ